MATRPFIDKTAGTPPPPVNDRLLLAEELLELAERAQAHTRAAGCALALKHGDKLFVRTSSGNAPEVGASLPLSDGAIGQCARLGKPLNITEEDKIDAVLRPLGVRSLIAVPIHHAGIFYGVAVVLGQTPDSFSRMHVAIVMTMGNEIARVLKRMEAVAVEIAPGSPLQSNTVAPAPVPANNVVTLELTPTARQNIVETIKTIEKKPEPTPTPVPMPMKLIIDPPAAATRTPLEVKTPVAPQSLASVTALPLETPAAPKPLPDLLPPGEDPRRYGTLKTAKSLEPKPTYVSANAYVVTSGSSHMKAPAIAVAVVVIVAAAFGTWRYVKTSTPATQQTVAAAEAAPAPVPVPVSAAVTEAPKVAPAVVSTPAPVAAAPKTEEKKPVIAKVEEEKPAATPEPALRLVAATKHNEVANAEAPALSLAAPVSMPDLGTPKAPAASLAIKRTTATPPTLLRTVAPVYPDIARRSGASGDVRMQLTISSTGKVANVKVIEGAPILRQAATSAVSQWQYRPATLDGRAVDSTVDVIVKFAR